MVSFESKLNKPNGVLVQQVPEGDSVLLHVKSGQYFGLDKMGHVIWSQLISSPSIQAAYDSILSQYEVAPDRLRTDMANLIQELVAHGLLEIVDS